MQRMISTSLIWEGGSCSGRDIERDKVLLHNLAWRRRMPVWKGLVLKVIELARKWIDACLFLYFNARFERLVQV